MGRLILLIIVIALVVIAVGTWSWMLKRNDENHTAGLAGRKARVRELESKTSKQESVLREIQQIATVSGLATGDPLWEMVAQKVEEALAGKDYKR